MIKSSLEKRTIIFFYFAIFAIIAILVLFYFNAQKVESTSNLVDHTQEVLRKSNDVQLDIVSIESSSRGFVLTGDRNYLTPFDNAVKTIYSNVVELKELTLDNEKQQLRIDLLQDLVKEKLVFMQKLIDVRTLKGQIEAEQLLATGSGRILYEKISKVITEIDIEEFGLLKLRKEDKKASTTNFDILFLLLLVLVTFVILLLIFISKAQIAKNKIADELSKTTDLFLNLFNYNPASIAIKSIEDDKIINVNYSFLELYGIISKDDVIGKTLQELNIHINHEHELEIAKLIEENNTLKDYEANVFTPRGESKWISASALILEVDGIPCLFSVSIDITHRKKAEDELLIVNKELEAFTYSVSHDLRAPLRAINGYAKIIQEDYASTLQEDGMASLNAIMKNSRKMGELIDDLLAFSRLGRKVVELTEINMLSLVTAVKEEELKAKTSTNEIECTILDILPALGQPALIRQVWVNLISNAVKYSNHKPKIIIEIGSKLIDNRVVYYVKDNGAGFDMQYYDKLFGVFQRLHSQEEFEGTGIGLAIVKKIINRHNGSVWAESKVNEGACFFFSLLPIN